MNPGSFNLDNKIYSNNNNLIIEIIKDLQQLSNSIHDNLIIKRIGDLIIKMNYSINENKKNTEVIINYISSMQNKLYNQMNKKFDEFKINNTINNKELRINNGKYIGQVVNGLAEGKGIWYGDNGDRYEGDWKNGKQEGKGIKYWHNDPWKGDIYEGEYKNDNKEGKGIYYYHNGDIYEGDFRDDMAGGKGIGYFNNGDRYEGGFKNYKFEGEGIFYFNNGDRIMGNYNNGQRVGRHVILTKNGDVKIENY